MSEITARDPRAQCATCGRRGTWAFLVARDGVLSRYCWRCWPAAHSANLDRELDDIREFFAGRHRPGVQFGGPPLPSSGALALGGGWHWILRPGSMRRMRRHIKRMQDMMADISRKPTDAD